MFLQDFNVLSLDLLSASDEELIDDVRKHNIQALQGVEQLTSKVAWQEIAVSSPMLGKPFHLSLETKSESRTVGGLCGGNVYRPSNDDRLLAYIAVSVAGVDASEIEYFVLKEKPCEVLGFINGEQLFSIQGFEGNKLKNCRRWEIQIRGQRFGVIKRSKYAQPYSMAIECESGANLVLPLRFGFTSKEFLQWVLKLLSLRWIWRDDIFVNNNVLVVPECIDEKNALANTIYFSVSLLFIAYVFRDQIFT